MVSIDGEAGAAVSPLELFVRSYALETTGEAPGTRSNRRFTTWSCQRARPLRLPRMRKPACYVSPSIPKLCRTIPMAQLASFGTPLIDRLLADALRRGCEAQFYLLGLNLSPHDLSGRVRRAVQLPPKVEIELAAVRALHFLQAVYWFQAEFVSDQKEQAIVPMALDLHYGRQVRHLEQLLDRSRLGEAPAEPLAEARRLSVAAAYLAARTEALRTIAALANVQGRELSERGRQQIARMTRYYADLRGELEDQSRRGRQMEDAAARLAERRTAIDREEQFRVAELLQKSSLRVSVRLLQLLLIEQPKLLVKTTVAAPTGMSSGVEMVWDPLTEAVEAIPCPACKRPGYSFDFERLQGQAGLRPACMTERGSAANPPGGRIDPPSMGTRFLSLEFLNLKTEVQLVTSCF